MIYQEIFRLTVTLKRNNTVPGTHAQTMALTNCLANIKKAFFGTDLRTKETVLYKNMSKGKHVYLKI